MSSKPADKGPVYMTEAAKLLGVTRAALKAKVHRMMNQGEDCDLPRPYQDERDGRAPWAWKRADFMAWLKFRKKLAAMTKPQE